MDNNCLPPDVREHINSYTREGVLSGHIGRVNASVRGEATVRMFRPLTEGLVMNRALRLWEGNMDNPFGFYFALQDYFVTWVTNNGVGWDIGRKQALVEDLCLFILDWFREV